MEIEESEKFWSPMIVWKVIYLP